MSALELRADLHQLIDQLDERFLKAVHSMVSVYQSSAEEDPVAGYDLHGNPKRASEMITVYEQRLAAMEAGEYISAEDLRKDAASWNQTYRVIVALEVWKQLREIVEWTEENHSPERAGKVKNVILSAIDSLAAMPTRHPIVRSVSTKGIIYRRILAERYRIVFTIFEQTATVKVVDIDHERRNPKLLIDKLNK